MKTLSIALLTFNEGLKNRIIYAITIAALLLIVFSIFLSGLCMRDILKILIDICLAAVSFGGLLVPLIITVSSVYGDLERKSAYTLLSYPISRKQYILGKYLGLCIISFSIMFILTTATISSVYVASLIYPKSFVPSIPILQIASSSLLAFFAVCILNGSAMLWCTICTSSFVATLLILSTYLVGQTVEDIVRFIKVNIDIMDMPRILGYFPKIIMYIFPNLAAFDFKAYAAHSMSIPLQEFYLLIMYAFSYSAFLLLITIGIFKNKDLV